VGNKAAGGPNNIQDQLDTETGILQPPNITNLRTIQRTLIRMARSAITDEVIHSRVNGMGRQQQQQQRQKQQQQQLQQQSLPVPLPESAPTDNVESPAKRQKQGNAVPATPSPSRPQQLSNICSFLGEDTIDKTDLQRIGCSITPKVHLMKAHCAWQMANLEGGLGDKGEDWVEKKTPGHGKFDETIPQR
jgi:hypothetical protein